jgi:hypothetical protein
MRRGQDGYNVENHIYANQIYYRENYIMPNHPIPREKIVNVITLAVPIFLGLLTTAIIPLSIWLIQNAYMAQATSVLVREMAIDLKEQRVTINELPPKIWQDRISRLEDSERQNRDAHTSIMISLERISTRLNIPVFEPTPKTPSK